VDRLLTYADGAQLSALQNEEKAGEQEPLGGVRDVFEDFWGGLEDAARRIRSFSPANLEEERFVGRARLPTTLGGLLVHCAEHTQRHIGQAITTSQIVTSLLGS
jgi:hypothetical protein